MARFGKYEVLGVLGRGGMAEVLKCELTGLGGFRKTFAVKRVVPSRAHDARFVSMLLDEARITARLNHPNIAQVQEIDELGQIPYIVMEFVDGPTLHQLMRRAKELGKWEVPHFLRVLSDVCLALDYAHRATDDDGTPLNIVHRDVSPTNIMVSRDGTTKLLDFGIAHASDRLSETAAGGLKGKVAYMAPEQALGGRLGPPADIFAVGCMLYQCATGRHPFPGDSAGAVIRALTAGNYRPPGEISPATCPPELARLIDSALVKNPEERCPSARALHAWIESYLAERGYPAGAAPVASWLRQLFPDGEWARTLEPVPPDLTTSGATPRISTSRTLSNTYGGGVRPLGTQDGAPSVSPLHGATAAARDDDSPSASFEGNPVPGSYHGAIPHGYAIVAQRSPLVWVFTGLISLSVVAAIVVFLVAPERFGLGGAPAPVADPQAATMTPPATDAAAALASYLEEIEALTRAQKHTSALDLLAKARTLVVSDAELNIRLGRVADATEVAAFTVLARADLDAGALDEAVEHAKAVLDRDFDNADARAVLARARELGDAGASVVRAEDVAAQPTGTLVISAAAGALVVVDDEPLGLAPMTIAALPAGEHRVEVRLRGFEPASRVVHVGPGATVRETVGLRPAALGATSSAAHAQVTAPARVAPAPAPTSPPTTASAQHAALVTAPASPNSPATAHGSAAAADARPPTPPGPERTPPLAQAASVDAAPARAAGAAPDVAPATATAGLPPTPQTATSPTAAASPAAPSDPPAPPPEPQPIAAPSLPATHSVQSAREIAAILARVEAEAIARGGVPAGQVSHCTAPLAKRLVERFAPGEPLELYPRGAYYKIVRMARVGKSREAIASALLRGHLAGDLLSYR